MEGGYDQFIKFPTGINSSSSLTFGKQHDLTKGMLCISQKRLLCRGIFNGDNPFKFVAPVFLAQLTLGSFLTNACQFLLKPFGQASIVGQILGGIIAGPTLLGQNQPYMDTIFPKKSLNLMETLSLFSCMMFLFLVGVRMDVEVVKRSGTKEWAIGILTFLLPQLISIPTGFILHNYAHSHSQVGTHDKSMTDGELPFIAILASMTSFHVISCVLHDLKLFNSEIGRLAGSISMISGMLSWVSLTVAFTIKQSLRSGYGILPCIVVLSTMVITVFVSVYAIRPLLFWMIRQTPEGKPIKESFVIGIILLFFSCCFLGQFVGQYPFFLPMTLGLIVPDGPPLGSTVVDKIDCFVSYVLLPLYFLLNGGEVNAAALTASTWGIVVSLISLATLGKFISTMLPCLFYRMPFKDSVSLSLILCSVGLVDLLSYTRALQLGYITNPSFSILCITAPIITGIISFAVKYLYDPSRRYICYRRRTIQHTHSELRILVCINDQHSVPAVLNILEASNPTKESPLGVYILHLFELVGRASPLLVAHRTPRSKKGFVPHTQSTQPTQTQRIINAFKIFENNNPGIVFVQTYTCIAPYSSMHDDIYTVAVDKYTSLLIIPFHKFWSSEGVMVESLGLRNVNKHVLAKSPCSVGILLELGSFRRPRSIHESWSFYRIGVIFLGGPDDRESLTYAIRMSAHPNVKLTVVRFIKSGNDQGVTDGGDDNMERKLDEDLINVFRVSNVHMGKGSNRISYIEEGIRDGLDTINVIRSMDDSYDLILAGRRHKSSSNFFKGLGDTNFPELGHIGDLLASSASKSTVSLLVVQQHTLEEGQVDQKEGQSLALEVSYSAKSNDVHGSSINSKKTLLSDGFQITKRDQ